MKLFRILQADYHFGRVEDIQLDSWWDQGIKGLILDVDDTLTRKDSLEIADSVQLWLQSAQNTGFQIILVSNNRSPEHIETLSKYLSIPAIAQAGKPRQRGFLWALKQMNLKPQQVVAIGDRVLTDVLGGALLGIQTCLVKPVTPETQLSLPKKTLYRVEKILSRVE